MEKKTANRPTPDEGSLRWAASDDYDDLRYYGNWISIKQSMPRKNHPVIVCYKTGTTSPAVWDGRQWIRAIPDGSVGLAITHWTGFPAVPSLS